MVEDRHWETKSFFPKNTIQWSHPEVSEGFAPLLGCHPPPPFKKSIPTSVSHPPPPPSLKNQAHQCIYELATKSFNSFLCNRLYSFCVEIITMKQNLLHPFTLKIKIPIFFTVLHTNHPTIS